MRGDTEYKGELWYAYKHVNGGIHVKRFFDDGDLKELRESDFVKDFTAVPFYAMSHEHAMEIAKEHL